MRNIEFCLDYLIVANKTEFVAKEGEESGNRGSIIEEVFNQNLPGIQEESQNSQTEVSSSSNSGSISSHSMRHNSHHSDRPKSDKQGNSNAYRKSESMRTNLSGTKKVMFNKDGQEEMKQKDS